MNQGTRTHRVICCGSCTPPIVPAHVVAQAVEALSGKGPVSELWGFDDRLVGSIGCAVRYLSACANSGRQGCSASSIVLRSSRSVATTLISGSPPTRNSYYGPRWYASRSRFGVLCEFDTTGVIRTNQARPAICAVSPLPVRGKADFTCLPSGREFYAYKYRLQTSSRECRNRLTRRRVNRCPGRRCHRPARPLRGSRNRVAIPRA